MPPRILETDLDWTVVFHGPHAWDLAGGEGLPTKGTAPDGTGDCHNDPRVFSGAWTMSTVMRNRLLV